MAAAVGSSLLLLHFVEPGEDHSILEFQLEPKHCTLNILPYRLVLLNRKCIHGL